MRLTYTQRDLQKRCQKNEKHAAVLLYYLAQLEAFCLPTSTWGYCIATPLAKWRCVLLFPVYTTIVHCTKDVVNPKYADRVVTECSPSSSALSTRLATVLTKQVFLVPA